MKKVVLCGHTGSINRGSEAIIKSTADLLNKQSIKVILATHELEQDKKMEHFYVRKCSRIYQDTAN